MPLHLSFRDVPKSGLPTEGEWPAVIKDALLEPNKSRDGLNLTLTFEFTAPEYAGKTIKRWFSLKSTVVGIAYEMLVRIGAIPDGADLDLVEDAKTLRLVKPNIINKPCILVMGQQEDSDFAQVEEVFGPKGKEAKSASNGEVDTPKSRPSLR